jgi:4-hydroxybenzoate polyprenyltransferase
MQQRSEEGRHLPAKTDPPLVIDARGAVWSGSLLLLTLCAYLKKSALHILHIAWWGLGGRRHLERRLANAGASCNVPLPVDPQLASLAVWAAAQGRTVYLAAPASEVLLHEVAPRHLAIAGVIAPDADRGGDAETAPGNLSERFPQGFDLVTGGRGDWQIARHAAAGATNNRPGSTKPLADVAGWLPARTPISELVRSLRLHHCVKNLLVFVPIILGGRLTDLGEVGAAVVAFVALRAIACGTYLVNDIWDVAEDRRHWSKRNRPSAAGRLAPAAALYAGLAAIGAGVLLGFLVSPKTGAMLLLYLGITLAYSLYLKAVVFLDGLALATLFTIRLGIGAAAADVPPSPWLFVFSMFLFASLCYAKRHTELVKAAAREDKVSNGRGYRPMDAPVMLTVGLSTGIGAVLIMVLYIVEEAFRSSFYGSTGWLWGFPPLIFLFVVRVWLLSARGEMSDDPVAFAIRDRISIALSALLMLCFGFAWLG